MINKLKNLTFTQYLKIDNKLYLKDTLSKVISLVLNTEITDFETELNNQIYNLEFNDVDIENYNIEDNTDSPDVLDWGEDIFEMSVMTITLRKGVKIEFINIYDVTDVSCQGMVYDNYMKAAFTDVAYELEETDKYIVNFEDVNK